MRSPIPIAACFSVLVRLRRGLSVSVLRRVSNVVGMRFPSSISTKLSSVDVSEQWLAKAMPEDSAMLYCRQCQFALAVPGLLAPMLQCSNRQDAYSRWQPNAPYNTTCFGKVVQ